MHYLCQEHQEFNISKVINLKTYSMHENCTYLLFVAFDMPIDMQII